MSKPNINIPKETLLNMDLMNTLGGGVSVPTVNLAKREDHYDLTVNVPGVSSDQLRVEIFNTDLHIMQSLDIATQNSNGEKIEAPRLIQTLPIPHNVDIKKIHAEYADGKLTVVLPLNEFSNGYHQRVEIN